MSVTLHTNYGSLKIELFIDWTPNTCHNFLALCASTYYTNKSFYRNIKSFLLQGVLPVGVKTTKNELSIYYNSQTKSYQFNDEITPLLQHNKRGILAMANKSNQLNTITSQFYILYAEQSQLNNTNTVFGQLIGADSYNTLDIIEKLPVDSKDRPIEPIIVESVTIHSNPFAE